MLHSQQGVSLLSLIVTLLVLSLVAVAVTQWGIFGFQGYRQGQDRLTAQLHWRFAEQRLSKELQHAVPNSVSVSADGKTLSYLPIVFSGRYQAPNLTDLDGFDVIWTAAPLKYQSYPAQSVRLGIALETPSEAFDPKYSTWVSQSSSSYVMFASLSRFSRASSRSLFYGYQQKIVWRLEGDTLWRETWDLLGKKVSRHVMGRELEASSFFQTPSSPLVDLTPIAWLWRWQGRHYQGVSQRQVQVLNLG